MLAGEYAQLVPDQEEGMDDRRASLLDVADLSFCLISLPEVAQASTRIDTRIEEYQIKANLPALSFPWLSGVGLPLQEGSFQSLTKNAENTIMALRRIRNHRQETTTRTRQLHL